MQANQKVQWYMSETERDLTYLHISTNRQHISTISINFLFLVKTNRIYAQFGGKEILILCIYLKEYMLIVYFSHFFCTRIVILLTSVRGKRTEVKIRHPGWKIRKVDTLSYKLSPKYSPVIGYKCGCARGCWLYTNCTRVGADVNKE